MKLLAIDRGNSRTKTALQTGHSEFEYQVFENDPEDSLLLYIRSISFDAAIMSTVAADNLKKTSEYLQSKGFFLLVDPHTSLPLKNEYATPETLGTDRITGAIGAWKQMGERDVLLVDAGTCMNYEFVINNIYQGGAISPGLRMRLKAMHDYTGKLPLLEVPDSSIELIGKSTSGCMASGAVLGLCREIEGFANEYEKRYPGIAMVLSGGDAPFLGKYLKNGIFALHKEVVLIGLMEILKFNLNAKN